MTASNAGGESDHSNEASATPIALETSEAGFHLYRDNDGVAGAEVSGTTGGKLLVVTCSPETG